MKLHNHRIERRDAQVLASESPVCGRAHLRGWRQASRGVKLGAGVVAGIVFGLLLGVHSVQADSGSVSPYYGSFATAVPIAVPPFRGLEPSVEITYGSSGGNGWCGVGGSLRAASLIERGLPEGGTPRYSTQDAFYLDGMELIATNLLGGTHCAKIQNYARITRDAVNNRWYVTGTQGNRVTYEPLLTNSLGTYRWAITRTEDPRGNAVQFQYWRDGTNDAYLATISYNGCQVLFNWELRQDPILFADGVVMRTTRYRLKSIDVKVGGQRARAYAVTYTTSPVSGRSLINSIQQFGRDAVLNPDGSVASGTSLPPMTFGWSTNATGQFGNRVDDNTEGFTYSGFDRFVTDVNGDGKDDILYVSDSEFAAFLSEGYGNFGARIAGGVDGPSLAGHTRTVGDMNADGFADVLYLGDTDVAVFLGRGNGTFGMRIQTAIASSQAGKTRVVADMTGDQRPDICFVGDSEITVLRGNGDGTFGTPLTTPTGYTDLGGVVRVTGDVNGDSRTDIAYISDTQYTLFIVSADGTFVPGIRQPLGTNYANYDRYLSDVNGDGKADLVFIGDTGFAVMLGLGNGMFLPAVTGTTGVSLSGYDRYLADVNGDGRSDVLYVNDAGFSVFPGRGDGTFGARIAGTTGGASLAGFSRRLGDLDGDGKADVAFVGDSSFAAFLSAGAPPDLVTLIRNGIGGTTEVDYQPSSGWRNTYMPKGMIMNTVAGLTTSDGRSTTNTVTYSYEGGLWSVTDKRFLGFRRVASVIDAQGDYTETYYFQKVGSISKPEFTYAKNNQGRIYSYSAYRYTENLAPPYTSLLTERWDYTLNLSDRARRTLTQFGYDQYANCIVTYEYGDFDVQGDERTTIRGYYPNQSVYIVGLPAYENTYVGIGSGGQLMARSVTHYDNNTSFAASPRAGNVTTVGKWHDQNGAYVYTRFDYDAYGNQTRQIDPLGYEGRMEFDAAYHLFPIREINALNQTMASEWDYVLGEKLSETDPNGSVMRFTYDALGRQLTVVYPDGASEAYSYFDTGSPNGQHTRRTITDGSADGLWSEIYRDGLGRVYLTRRKGDVEQMTEYRGTSDQVLRKSLTYHVGETPVWGSFEYDGLGRVRRAYNPDSSYSETLYANDTDGKPVEVTYNELGAERMTWSDAYGQIVEVRERVNGQYAISSYAYNVIGKLVQSVDPGGLVTQVKWDSLGRKLEVLDPNLGTIRYEYDARSAMLKSTDARGNAASYSYDPTGRILRKTTSDGAVYRWFYDQLGHGASIGRLTREEYPLGYTQHIWDRRGRETATVRRIGTDTVAIQSDFDIAGRLATLTYPDGQVARHHYNSEGQLTAVDGVASNLTWSAAGQLLSIRYANGTQSQFNYDNSRRWLSRSEVTGAAGQLYEAQYQYDARARIATVASATNPDLNEQYDYDELDRLTSVTGPTQQRFEYDLSGRILFKSDVGAYDYADPAHPSTPTRAGRMLFTYDAGGNQIARDDETRLWNAENRLAQVQTASGVIQYGYDQSGARIERRSGTRVTRYFGQLAEMVDGKLVKYFFAGPMLVCRRDADGGVWYHADHLGSPRTMTDDTGAVVKRNSYRAYGEADYADGPALASVGFGGHVPDLGARLLYMGARFYDEQLGLFLSPDTIVPDPGRTQAHNRYIFAFNNPINNTDPTGHAPVVIPIITAISVTASGAGTFISAVAWIGAGLSVAGYYTHDPVLSTVGGVMLGFASGYAAPGLGAAKFAGWGGGLLGGSVAAATSPLSPLDSNVKVAVGWAYTGIGSVAGGGGKTFGDTAKNIAEGLMTRGMQEVAGRVFSEAAEGLGLDKDEFNAVLIFSSFVGNALCGSRFRGEVDGKHLITGFFDHAQDQNPILKGHLTFPFDVIDTALVLQGLPSASGYDYAIHMMTTHDPKSMSALGHSLGSFEVNVLASYGLTPAGAVVECLPIGGAGAPGVNVTYGSRDIINGGAVFGFLLSPFGTPEWQASYSGAHGDYPHRRIYSSPKTSASK